MTANTITFRARNFSILRNGWTIGYIKDTSEGFAVGYVDDVFSDMESAEYVITNSYGLRVEPFARDTKRVFDKEGNQVGKITPASLDSPGFDFVGSQIGLFQDVQDAIQTAARKMK